MELKKQKLCLILILTLLIISFTKNVVAVGEPAENERGICDAWLSKDGENWENTTAKTSLKLGETFYIKIMVKAKMELKFLRYQLSSYGPPYDFELVKPPSNLGDNSQILQHSDGREIGDVRFSDVKSGEKYIHIWKLRVKTNSTFGGGNTPINLDSFFFDGNDESQMIFTVVSVTIIDEIWEKDSEENQEEYPNHLNENRYTQGFEMIALVLAIEIICILKKNNFF